MLAKIVAIYAFFSDQIENFGNHTGAKHLTNSKSGGVHAFLKLKTDDDDEDDYDNGEER